MSVGNLAATDKVDGLLDGYFERVFGEIGGRMKDFVPLIKFLIYSKLGGIFGNEPPRSKPRGINGVNAPASRAR